MLDESFFISSTVHEKDVELADGKRHKLYFKEIAYIDFARFQAGAQSDDEHERAAASAKLIATSLCNKDGTEAITVERAGELKPSVGTAIFNAAVQVSSPAKKKPLKKAVKGTSGTS